MKQEEDTTTPEKMLAIPFPGSLRDWFAGQALAGLLADSKRSRKLYENAGGDEGILRCNSEWAYSLADAMLAERSKE